MAGMTSRQTQSRLVDLLFFLLGSLYLTGIAAAFIYVVSKMVNYF
jgi:predicted HAD superfamily Cof-like phosphohydrolase